MDTRPEELWTADNPQIHYLHDYIEDDTGNQHAITVYAALFWKGDQEYGQQGFLLGHLPLDDPDLQVVVDCLKDTIRREHGSAP